MKNIKNKIGFLGLILVLLSSVSSVYGSIGSASTPVLARTSSGGDVQLSDLLSTREFWVRDGYIYGVAGWGGAVSQALFDTVYTPNNGSTWSDAGGYGVGVDGTGKKYSGLGWAGVVVDTETYLGHEACVQMASVPYHVYYNNAEMGAIAGIFNPVSYSGFTLTNSTYDYISVPNSASMCLLDHKPVVVSLGRTGSPGVYLQAWFSTVADPTSSSDFSYNVLDWYALYGYTGARLHVQPVNSTAVLIVLERNSESFMMGVYATSSGFGTPFAFLEETTSFKSTVNGYYVSQASLWSEYTENTSVYAENIACSWVNSSGYVRFGVYDVSESSWSDFETIAGNTTTYDPFGTSLAKVNDTYFLTWNGDIEVGGDHLTTYVSERDPNTETWETSILLTQDMTFLGNPNVAYQFGAFSSKVAIPGSGAIPDRLYFHVKNETDDDTYIFHAGVVGDSITGPTESLIPWELSNLIIGLVGAFMCIFGPLWCVVQIHSGWGNLAYGFGFGFAITFIGIGLLAVWLL